MVSRLVDLTNMNVDALRVDSNTWGDQFRNAMNVNGGDVENATALDYVLHFLTFGWKVSCLGDLRGFLKYRLSFMMPHDISCRGENPIQCSWF